MSGMYDDEPDSEELREEPPRRSRALLITVVILVALFLVFTGFAAFWTERLWFSSVGYQEVFNTLLRTKTALVPKPCDLAPKPKRRLSHPVVRELITRTEVR